MAKKPPTFEDALNLTALEREIITLTAVLGMIRGMVNREVMTFYIHDPDSEIRFNSISHQALFNILLVDFFSTPAEFFNSNQSYLERLLDICNSPAMGDKDILPLRNAVTSFMDWLSTTVAVEKRWFPGIDLEIDLNIQRQTFITICGNLSKHNITQQTRQAKKLLGVFKENGKDFSIDECLIALEDFETQFSQDIFLYHAATIAEFLNNIRWGIYYYAHAERQRCVVEWWDSEIKINAYRYNIPTDIKSKLGEKIYWDLMNDVRSEPYIPKFEVTKYLKMRY